MDTRRRACRLTELVTSTPMAINSRFQSILYPYTRQNAKLTVSDGSENPRRSILRGSDLLQQESDSNDGRLIGQYLEWVESIFGTPNPYAISQKLTYQVVSNLPGTPRIVLRILIGYFPPTLSFGKQKAMIRM